MNRIRIGAGLLIAVVGTLWWSGALPAAGATLVVIAPYLLLLWAFAAAARTIIPRGGLAGPAVLAAAGGAWLLFRADVVNFDANVRQLAIAVVLIGVLVALTGGGRDRPHFGVQRFSSFLYGREFPVTGRAPSKISVLSVLFPARLDLSRTEHSDTEEIRVEIDVTVLAGRVDIVLPPMWVAETGRILSTGVRYNDELVHSALWTPKDGSTGPTRTAMINVIGLGGRVLLHFHR